MNENPDADKMCTQIEEEPDCNTEAANVTSIGVYTTHVECSTSLTTCSQVGRGVDKKFRNDTEIYPTNIVNFYDFILFEQLLD